MYYIVCHNKYQKRGDKETGTRCTGVKEEQCVWWQRSLVLDCHLV